MGSVRLLKNISGLWPFQQCRAVWKRQGKEYSWSGLVEMASAAKPLQSLIHPDDPRFVAPENMVEAIQAFYRETGQTVLASPGDIARSC